MNFIPAKLDVWRESLRYGIGQHAKQAQDTGRGDLIVQTKYPIGTDPQVMDRLLRIAADPKQSERLFAAIDRLGLDSGDQPMAAGPGSATRRSSAPRAGRRRGPQAPA